jgi:hypothetical protein
MNRIRTTRFLSFTFLLSMAAVSADESLPMHARSATQMTAAAGAFVATLNEEQLGETVFALDADARATWSNLPIVMVRPDGFLIGSLNDDQRRALHDLLRASMSSQGYGKISNIMRLDDLLYEIEVAAAEKNPNPRRRQFAETRSSGNYAVAIYGDPGNGDWGWKLAGHHAAVNFTVADGQVGFTPTFLGSSPMTLEEGRYAGYSALPHEGARGVDFMASLNTAQQKAALLDSDVPRDIFEGPGRRASLSDYEGLRTDELSVVQMQLLRVLIEEYVRNVDFDAADAQLALINETGWDELWFSWRGPVDINGEFYYRVHGPRLLIEYNRQNPNHDHMIVRDPMNDYGEDWLEQHYTEHHPAL